MSDHNPYSPPTVNVERPSDTDAAPSPRPPRVTLGVRLLWASLLFSFAVSIPLSDLPVRDLIIGLGVAGAFLSLLLIKIAQGRNWARITHTLLVGAGVLMIVTNPLGEGDPGWFARLTLLRNVVDIVATAMLFTKPASPWFRRRYEPTRIEATGTADSPTGPFPVNADLTKGSEAR